MPYYKKTIQCAVCDRLKGETNHWFAVSLLAGGFLVDRLTREVAAVEMGQPTCGAVCTQTLLERWLQEIPTPPAPKLAPGEAFRRR